MWLASHWTVRAHLGWRDEEDRFFRHLLDGSRAASRLGWAWTVGAGTGKPHGFSRRQVENRAPGLCAGCALNRDCPVRSCRRRDRTYGSFRLARTAWWAGSFTPLGLGDLGGNEIF